MQYIVQPYFRCLFYLNVSALRSGHYRIFRHDSSSKWMYSIQSALKFARCELKLYVRGIRCHIHLCLKMLLSTKQWMNVSKWSKLQQISPAEGVGSNGLGVDRLSAPILSILPIIDIGHFKNRFVDNYYYFFNFFFYANKHTIYRWHYLLVNK